MIKSLLGPLGLMVVSASSQAAITTSIDGGTSYIHPGRVTAAECKALLASPAASLRWPYRGTGRTTVQGRRQARYRFDDSGRQGLERRDNHLAACESGLFRKRHRPAGEGQICQDQRYARAGRVAGASGLLPVEQLGSRATLTIGRDEDEQ